MAATPRKMDFTNVKEGGNFSPRHVEEGDYVMKIVKVEDGVSRSDNEQWVFTLKRKGDERATYPYYCGTDEKQAWKVRKLFIAAGMQVPKKMVRVDPNKLVGKEIGAALEDDEYEGRMRSKIADTFPVSEVSEPDDDDDETPVTTKKKASKKVAPVVEDDDEEDIDVEDDDEDEEEEAPPPPRRKKKVVAKKTTIKRKKAPEPEDDEDEDDLDELDMDEI